MNLAVVAESRVDVELNEITPWFIPPEPFPIAAQRDGLLVDFDEERFAVVFRIPPAIPEF